jgi:uncharacterized protein (DUF1684 family)
MFNTRLLKTTLAAAVLALVAAGCNPPPPDERSYEEQEAARRATKDAQFQSASNDPIPDGRKAALLPLDYFPIDPAYHVPASLTLSDDPTVIEMQTSTGKPRRERRAGRLDFTLQGQQMSLTAFVEADARDLNRLFLPFSDSTSGKETYPAGRYLELDRSPTGLYELDFNHAFNPYCYYNESYECPLPPPENRLKIPITAGEKVRK